MNMDYTQTHIYKHTNTLTYKVTHILTEMPMQYCHIFIYTMHIYTYITNINIKGETHAQRIPTDTQKEKHKIIYACSLRQVYQKCMLSDMKTYSDMITHKQ